MSEGGETTSADRSRGRRKRLVNKEKWIKAVTKRKRNSGESYVSLSTKKTVPARERGMPCSCSNKCFDKVGVENVESIFEHYWKMGDHNAQTHYLISRICINEVKRRRVKKNEKSRRSKTKIYIVKVGDEIINVCLKAFIAIHGISEKRVRYALSKDEGAGTFTKDRRGKHKPSNKTPEEARDLVKVFISKLPTCTSHYSQAKSPNRVYLPPGSSIQGSYKNYLEYLKSEKKEQLKVSHAIFSMIFKTEFNIGVEPPKSNTCNFCDSVDLQLKSLNENKDIEKIRDLTHGKQIHLRSAKTSQKCRSILQLTYNRLYQHHA